VLKQVLETVLSKDASGRTMGKLDYDPQQSIFIIRDTKIVLDKVNEIVERLDVEPDQVILDVKFISTANRDLLDFGVNWNFGGQDGFSASTRFLNPTSFTTPQGEVVSGKITKLPFGLGRETGGVGQDQKFLTSWDGTLLFRAFKQDQFSRILQEPTLAVVDNTEATIFVGETISYPEVRTTTNQFGGLEFTLGEAAKSPVKVGFQLFVAPKIVAEQNRVILTVIPLNEVLSGPSTGAAVPGFVRFTLVSNGADQSIDLPRISQTQLVSRLVVESGRTAVLGGLVVERTTYQDQGVPVLKDIPLINYLFKRRTDDVSKEHLLIFLTPRIVRKGRSSSESLQEILKLREQQERREFEEARKREAAQPQK
jgi:type II secretory pathway component GspD/PulD (secretin)